MKRVAHRPVFVALSWALGLSLTPGALALAQAPQLELRTLSSRPDLVSGGDALIELRAPAGVEPGAIALTLNGEDVSERIAASGEPGRFVGRIDGLRRGSNALRAELVGEAGGAAQAQLELTNHPITGPILSGPHLAPYECRTEESGLGAPLDANCSARPRVDYFYRTSGGAFAPLEPDARPDDLASTTTRTGETVPYIVRVDSGTINRAVYRIAVLDDPASSAREAEGEAWTPGAGWNRRLVVSFGGGNGTQYNQGSNAVTAALSDRYLSRGYAHMVATELVNNLHSNAVLQGETLMMLKEYFIERYGVPRWTLGSGGSGGAIQQLVITQIYPGLLDGLQPSLAFPDSTLHTADCGLLQNFFREADPEVWTEAKQTAVAGYSAGTCERWARSYARGFSAANVEGCALRDSSQVYDAETNPQGARCTVQDMRANIYGRHPETGHARKPQDNVGIQYGLGALRRGVLSVDEFLELNEKIGGQDLDGRFTAERSEGDPIALRAVYASGLLNSGGGGLANVPILHTRPYTDAAGDIHDRGRDLTIRARLEAANGRSDNQVIWIGPRGRRGGGRGGAGPDLAELSIEVMGEWLDAIADDPAPLSTDKVVKHRPAAAVDACFTAEGARIDEVASLESEGRCGALYPPHLEPRLVAGAPLANDVLKCQLQPVRDFAYGDVEMTAEQRERLAAIFPEGVCDYTRPGVGQGPIAGTYQRY